MEKDLKMNHSRLTTSAASAFVVTNQIKEGRGSVESTIKRNASTGRNLIKFPVRLAVFFALTAPADGFVISSSTRFLCRHWTSTDDDSNFVLNAFRDTPTRRERRLVAIRKQVKKERSEEKQKLKHVQGEEMQQGDDEMTSMTSSLEEDGLRNTTSSSGAPPNTFGSLLLKLQKEEEEEMRKIAESDIVNATTALEDQIRMAQHVSTAEEEQKSDTAAIPTPETISPMDRETVRELDDAVTRSTRDVLLQGVEILKDSPLLDDSTRTSSKAAPKEGEFDPQLLLRSMPLSMPEHYSDRIGRDMRHLAVSIASSTDEVWQWRLFCSEKGGIVPLLQCVRDGVKGLERQGQNNRRLRRRRSDDILLRSPAMEEDFIVACTACRSLRDLCALSPEMAAVMTDGILRANEAWPVSPSHLKMGATKAKSKMRMRRRKRHRQMSADTEPFSRGGPISDFVALLKHANDFELSKEARDLFRVGDRRNRREARRRSKLYVLQLLLAMAVASDDAIHVFRSTPGLVEAVLASSSYARTERTRRWLRYPIEVVKRWVRTVKKDRADDRDDVLRSRPFIEAASLGDDLQGQVQGTANQLLAAIGCNQWIPKIPGQRGLRILCIDGGGSRGMAAVTSLNCLVKAMGNAEACDTFDMIVGTSTGAIIAFLVGLRRESSDEARERYNVLIRKIFVKSALSTPLMLFTTATYDETPFMSILSDILGDSSMLDSRSDPAVPLVFAVTSKMSSTPTHVALFRNYNYAGGELPDSFVIDPFKARETLQLPLDIEHEFIQSAPPRRMPNVAEGKLFAPGARLSRDASRHPGSFRVLQRHALRASTAAPTVFKPVFMGGEVYCDGGIVASNPAAVAIHEARTLFPNIPIEMVVSIGTGGFTEEKSAPRIGWDGIIGQIVDSATDGEQIHHILEDILGDGGMANLGKASVSKTRYYRLNPVIGGPNDFPIDVTDPKLLRRLSEIAEGYFEEPEQKRKIEEINEILEGIRGWRKLLGRWT